MHKNPLEKRPQFNANLGPNFYDKEEKRVKTFLQLTRQTIFDDFCVPRWVQKYTKILQNYLAALLSARWRDRSFAALWIIRRARP